MLNKPCKTMEVFDQDGKKITISSHTYDPKKHSKDEPKKKAPQKKDSDN